MAKRKVQIGGQEGQPLEEVGLIDQIKEAIRRSGHSLNQLEQTSGVGRDRLSRFMRGERGLTLDAAEKLCRVLGLHLTGKGRKAASAPQEPPAAAGQGQQPSGEKDAPAGRQGRKKGRERGED